MIFQPGSGGSGGGLKVYSGTIVGSYLKPGSVSFETPVKLVFVTFKGNIDGVPAYQIILPGEEENIPIYDSEGEPPVTVDTYYVSLSNDGKTLTCSNTGAYLYYALG